jgi:hypothetical protein
MKRLVQPEDPLSISIDIRYWGKAWTYTDCSGCVKNELGLFLDMRCAFRLLLF